MKKIILSFLLLSTYFFASAQQEPQFTQYFDNTLFVNPAYAGSKDAINATAIHREQWVGFNGRPRSSVFSIHSPLKYRSIGMGLSAVYDKIGPMNQTMVYGDISYSLRFKNSDSKLAFGIKGGISNYNFTTSDLFTTDANDGRLENNVRNKINGNFGVGVYFHNSKFFAGVSVPRILQQSYDTYNSKAQMEKRVYYGIVGGVIPVNNILKLRPVLFTKLMEGAPISAELSLAAIFFNKFYVGGMYRYNAAAGAFVQFQVAPSFRVGIASDFGVQKLRKYNDGTFEVMISYQVNRQNTGIQNPRFF